VLRELTIWRDGAARHHNLPPRAFLKDEILIDLSRNPAKSVDKLDRVRGPAAPGRARARRGDRRGDAARVVARRRNLPVQRNTELSPTERFRSDALWAAAQAMCAGSALDPAVVTSRQEMADFTRNWLQRRPVRLAPDDGWRREALGEPLRTLFNGGPAHRDDLDRRVADPGCAGLMTRTRSDEWRRLVAAGGSPRAPARAYERCTETTLHALRSQPSPAGQLRHLAKAGLQVRVQLRINAVVPVVEGGRLGLRRDLLRLLDRALAGLLDARPHAGADAGQQGDAVSGTLGGVREDDRLLVEVSLELSPEVAARPPAAGADLGDCRSPCRA
jgi:hypothetical protein